MISEGDATAAGAGRLGIIEKPWHRALAANLDPEPTATSAAPAASNEAPTKRSRPAETRGSAESADRGQDRRRAPQRDSIMTVIERDCRLWHAPDSESFVSFTSGAHIEHASVRSLEFRRWLCQQAFEATGLVPGGQAIEDALRIAEAMAQKEIEKNPWMRVGARGDRLYVDICDRSRTYVDISKHGWQMRADGDAPFVRTPAMRPLCEPSEPGTSPGIDVLRPFVNVASDQDFTLAVGWLLGALRPSGPYPLLVIGGQQGAGKSTFSRLLRQLTDPNAAPIRQAPKDSRDLIVAACNAHVQAFDNLSRVDNDLSDSLCRLATGGGFSSRQLHTDRSEMIFYGQRPVILNGIPALAERADLADRSMGIRLVTINESTRRTEAEFWRDFEMASPDILCALLDAMVEGVRNLPTTRLDRPPRLADFATWVTACEPGLGWRPGTFMNAFEANRQEVNDTAFEADTVAVAIRDMVRDEYSNGWEGTPTALLGILNTSVPEDVRRSRSWPYTAQALGSRVDRAAPLLRGQGILIERRHSGSRFIAIVPTATASTRTSGHHEARAL